MNDVYNGDWKTPAHTAMCLWEEVMFDTDKYPFIDAYREGSGINATRELILNLVEKCDEAWLVAAAHGYDLAFDWDFVPMFLILWCARQNASGEEIGHAILDGWKHANDQRKGGKDR